MTTQPEDKDKAEQKVSKDELSEKELEKATGGGTNAATKTRLNISEISITKSTDASSTS
jgi:hypothetical protein